jgi:cysteine synthase B
MTLDPLLASIQSRSLTELVGNTPLIPIEAFDGVSTRARVLGKAEWFNPGGSVKDRAALAMVREGLSYGGLGSGRTLIDATSGNTGISYAWMGASLGFLVRLCVPANASRARLDTLRALGADLVLTSPDEGTDGAVEEVRRIVAGDPARYFYPDQYSNPANWRAHQTTTAEEIWRDTDGTVTHLVAGIGTAGTLVGTSRGLREMNPGIVVVAVQPRSPLHVFEGLKHLPSCRTPAIYDPRAHQQTIEVTSEEGIDAVRRLARQGLLVGWSSGAAVAAAERLARTLTTGTIVAILPDGAERYRSDPLWKEIA